MLSGRAPEKLIVAGTRTFHDWELLGRCLRQWFGSVPPGRAEIVCGCAAGADTLGADWAHDSGVPVKFFHPDWNAHGKAAGPIRNQLMAEYADGLMAFWEGRSPGTKDMITRALEHGLWVKVVRYLPRVP